MEPTVMMPSPSRQVQQRLDLSLNNLLESEVILGDDDVSSCGSESEAMHSALEELSEASVKFADCSTRSSSITDSSLEASKLQNHPMMTQSMYHCKTEDLLPRPSVAVPQTRTSAMTRSSSTLSSRTLQNPRSRLLSPRQAPSYADGTVCSKSRLASPSPGSSGYGPARRSVTPSSPSSAAQPATPTSLVRKPSNSGPRPAVPPKPAGLSPAPGSPMGLTRQTSSLKSRVTPESPVCTVRRTSSHVTAPAARSFISAGKQLSAVRSTPTKRYPEMDRYATLGRRPKAGSPSVAPSTHSPPSNSSTSMDHSGAMMKATADKFATLPRRKPVKDRPTLPKPAQSEITSRPTEMSFSGATLPRPRKLSSPSSPSSGLKAASPKPPRTLIYHEKSAQTELLEQDVRDGLEASLKLRSLSWHQQNSDEIRQLEEMLQQSKEEAQLLQRELDEEREERQVVQRELERTTQRVAAMLDSMEGVEREFHSRGDSLMHLETNLQTSTQAVALLQEQLEAQETALIAQRLELDRSLLAEKALAQQLSEAESESREMTEFLQAEKLALMDAVRDSESEMQSLRAQLEEGRQQLAQKEEECTHLVRLAEQRRHELAALQADLKGAEGRTGSVLLAQGAQLSAAALALAKLHSRMDGLLQSLMQSHRLPPGELEAVVFPNEAYKPDDPASPATPPVLEAASSSSSSSSSAASDCSPRQPPSEAHQQLVQRLVGSSSLQDLSDAINLTRRRLAPEGREEPNPVVDEELRLAASLVDQIEEADHVLSKLLRVLRRLILDKDSAMQQLSDEKEQLLASLSAQMVNLQEAKEELSKLRQMVPEEEEDVPVISKKEEILLGPYYNGHPCWTKTVYKVLESLPIDVVREHPALQQLLQCLNPLDGHNGHDDDFGSNVPHDPNANGSSV